MTSRISKLVLAAAIAASLPAAAGARDCDHDRAPRAHVARRDGPHPRWREAERREHLLRGLRAELHALDVERAEFHARNAWNPRRLRRYDRAWAERRAELERRHRELQRVAWR